MKSIFFLAVGAVLFVLGAGYCFRPDIVERVNNLIKEHILNDVYVMLERKKWGACLMLFGFLLVYIGLSIR
ncbi:MAG TPA: hypothetical protein PLL10_03240 [Elusimicrobiales bacterium]|nr:hypothetical protein [Elusimicrobiales bacterium]